MSISLRGISRTITVVIIVVILIIASASGYYFVSTQNRSSTTSYSGPSSITIGCSADLSGPLSALNIPSEEGSVAAQQYVNNVLGGVYVSSLHKKLPVNLQCFDDQSTPSNAVGIIQKLASENVTALIGPSGTPVVFAYISTVQQDQIPIVVTGAFGDNIWNLNYSYAFCQCPKSSAFATLVESTFLKQLNATHAPAFHTAAYVYDGIGNTNIQAQAQVVIKLLTSMGIKNLLNASIPTGQTSYASVVQQLAAAKPDYLYANIEDVPTATEFMKELSVQGVHPLLIQTYPQTPGSLQSIGSTALGTIASGSWIPALAPVNQTGVSQQLKFFENYSKSQGWSIAVEGEAAGGFSSFMTVVQAIESAGSLDHAAIANALHNTYYNIWGPWEPIEPSHTENYWPALLTQVQMVNGTEQAVPLYPVGAPGVYAPNWSSA